MERHNARSASGRGLVVSLRWLGPVSAAIIRASIVTLGIALVLLSNPVGARPVARGSVPLAEPFLAAAFVAAYSRGDEVKATQVASPLYGAEWVRLGPSPLDRQALIPEDQYRNQDGQWLAFTYVGGAFDGKGFGHLLYTARPTDPTHASVPSAWRIDTDPSGRVIWAELVYLFSDDTTALTLLNQGDRVPVVGQAGEGTRPAPHLVAELWAGVGPEAYYAVVVPNADDSVVFFGVDADGTVRPGAWTYGQTHPGPSVYGPSVANEAAPLDPNLAALRASYLDALCGGC